MSREETMADSNLKGSCLCGAVSYEVTGEPMMVGHCHCLDCRKSSGAGHVTIAAFPMSAFKVAGTTKTHKTKADSGMLAGRSFCPECGTWVHGTPDRRPDVVAINIATLDDPEALKPQMRFYDKRRLSWDTVDPSLPAFETLPPM
jgi:hypothetical protein